MVLTVLRAAVLLQAATGLTQTLLISLLVVQVQQDHQDQPQMAVGVQPVHQHMADPPSTHTHTLSPHPELASVAVVEATPTNAAAMAVEVVEVLKVLELGPGEMGNISLVHQTHVKSGNSSVSPMIRRKPIAVSTSKSMMISLSRHLVKEFQSLSLVSQTHLWMIIYLRTLKRLDMSYLHQYKSTPSQLSWAVVT